MPHKAGPEGGAEAASDAEVWSHAGAQAEARALVVMVGRNGDDAASLRRLIGVSASEEVELRRWAEESPELAVRIEGVLFYRADVLAEFEALMKAKT